MKRVFYIFLAFLALSACGPRQDQAAPERPNIILVITDDQGYGDLGIHGNPFIRTPALDSLAKKSTRIDPFYVCPVCAPTRSSLMTGRYHLRTGVYDTYNGGAMMATEEVTVAEVLAANGYHTAMVGKWHLGDSYPMRPMDQGFQYYLAHKGGGIGQPGDDFGNYSRPDSSYFDPYLWENGERVRRKGYCSDIFTDQAIAYIKDHINRRERDPFFLYLSYNAPHTPLQLPEEYWLEYQDMNYGSEDFQVSGKNVADMNNKDLDAARKVYGMVSNIDDNLGRLFKTLEYLELEENTLLVFITDNGPQQRRFTAGLNERKGSVLEGGIRVPCLFYWKGKLQQGRIISEPSAHIDMMPTLLDFAGILYEGSLDGVSLYPALMGETAPEKERSLFFVWERGFPQRYFNMAVRSGDFKLVGKYGHGVSSDSLKLYDLIKDPYELEDVASAYPEVKSRLMEKLDSWHEEIILSQHLVEPPRMIIGSPREKTVILGRNDWKGPKAMRWGSVDAYGYWDVKVEDPGPYEVRLVFKDPLPGPGFAKVRVGTRQYGVSIKDPASTVITLEDLSFEEGDHMFEGWYQIGGSVYGPVCIEIEKK
jgi:arylsulfatase